MASRGEAMERTGEAEKVRVESSRGVLASAVRLHSPNATIGNVSPLLPPTSDCNGKMVSRRLQGEAPSLVMYTEVARNAVSGFLVVGRFLSPF